MTKEIVFDNLVAFKNAANKCNIKYWLLEGLLLGLYRDGHPIEGDEDDTDIGIEPINEEKRIEFVNALESEGLKIWVKDGIRRDNIRGNDRLIAMQVERNGNRIDIMVMYQSKEWVYAQGKNYYLRFPKELFKKRGTIKWNKEKFDTVKPIKKFLDYKYPEWKKPILRKDGYNGTDQNYNPAYTDTWKPEE